MAKRFKKFQIWRDPVPAEQMNPAPLPVPHSQAGPAIDRFGWTPINAPSASSDLVSTPKQEQESFPNKRRFGAELSTNWSLEDGYLWVPQPAPYLETAETGIEDPESASDTVDSEVDVVGTDDPIHPDVEVAETSIEALTSDSEITDSDLEIVGTDNDLDHPEVEAAEFAVESVESPEKMPAARQVHNSFSDGHHTWPASKASVHPVPARAAPGSEVTPKELYPFPTKPICSCKQPAKTKIARIVQCKNPECSIGWYHYDCLDNIREKAFSRWGTFLCDVCKGDAYWGKKEQETGVTDFSMPFSQKEVVSAIVDNIMGTTGTSGAGDPYGLGGVTEAEK